MARKIAEEFSCRFEWLMGYDNFATLNERLHSISDANYEVRQSIIKTLELHRYEVGMEQVVCQRIYKEKNAVSRRRWI